MGIVTEHASLAAYSEFGFMTVDAQHRVSLFVQVSLADCFLGP